MSKYDFELDLSGNTSTGMILEKIEKGSTVLEFGCATGRMTRYMKEAMGAVIAHLFAEENLECISARVFATNTASRALLKSLGFQQNGIIPRCVKGYHDVVFDDVIHTLFREDFL
jgi:hypothetical protein